MTHATNPLRPVSTPMDAPWAVDEHVEHTLGKVGYLTGVEPLPRTPLPGYDTGVITLLILVFVVLAINMRHYSTFLKTFTKNLWQVRSRSNVFDDHTVSETRVLASLVLLVCVCEGVLLYFLMVATQASTVATAHSMPVFQTIGLLSLLAVAYYLFQLLSYRLVGYVFTSRFKAVQWVEGFNASQSLLGLALLLPVVILLFNPAYTVELIWGCGVLYVIARLIFICKGFRIFYHNLFSLVYFFLYFCTLEIVPLIIVYKGTLVLANL